MKLKGDPDGHSCISLGKDGVVRSIHTETKQVIDAKGLSPDQLKEVVETLPVSFRDKMNYDGVDGRLVSHEEQYRAPPERQDSEAWKKRTKEIMERQREIALSVKDPKNLTDEEFVERYKLLTAMWQESKFSVLPEDPAEKEDAEKWNDHCDMYIAAQKEAYEGYLGEKRETKSSDE